MSHQPKTQVDQRTAEDKLEARLRSLFERLFNINPDQINDQVHRGELEEWDSLGHLDLLEALRVEFHIEIPPDDALSMETFADVKRTVRKLTRC